MSKNAIAVLAAALALGGLVSQGQAQAQKSTSVAPLEFKAGAVTVREPWARATPGGAKVGGVFLEIVVASGAEDRLVGARSPASAIVELHDHVNDGGVMRMRRIEAVAIKGAKSVMLQPGGLHVMMMDLGAPLKAGDTLKLTLIFEKAGELEIAAPIRAVGHQPGHAAKPGTSTKPHSH